MTLMLGFGANAQAAATAFWAAGSTCSTEITAAAPLNFTAGRNVTASLCAKGFNAGSEYICDFGVKLQTSAMPAGLFTVPAGGRVLNPTLDNGVWNGAAVVIPADATTWASDFGGQVPSVPPVPVDPGAGNFLLATFTFNIGSAAGAGPYAIDLVQAYINTSPVATDCLNPVQYDITASLALAQPPAPPDTTPPVMNSMSCGAALTNVSSRSFTFSATDNVGVTGFECTLDGAAAACTSLHGTGALGDGAHTFFVRAKDAAGNWSAPTPTCSWTVDTIAPVAPTLTSTPPNPDDSQTATFAFTGEAGATFQCSLNGGAYASCSSPATKTLSAPGNQTFSVRAVDAAGNVGAAVQFAWVSNFVPAATATTTSIPTLSEWGLILLGLLLASSGVGVAGRGRRTQ